MLRNCLQIWSVCFHSLWEPCKQYRAWEAGKEWDSQLPSLPPWPKQDLGSISSFFCWAVWWVRNQSLDANLWVAPQNVAGSHFCFPCFQRMLQAAQELWTIYIRLFQGPAIVFVSPNVRKSIHSMCTLYIQIERSQGTEILTKTKPTVWNYILRSSY